MKPTKTTSSKKPSASRAPEAPAHRFEPRLGSSSTVSPLRTARPTEQPRIPCGPVRPAHAVAAGAGAIVLTLAACLLLPDGEPAPRGLVGRRTVAAAPRAGRAQVAPPLTAAARATADAAPLATAPLATAPLAAPPPLAAGDAPAATTRPGLGRGPAVTPALRGPAAKRLDGPAAPAVSPRAQAGHTLTAEQQQLVRVALAKALGSDPEAVRKALATLRDTTSLEDARVLAPALGRVRSQVVVSAAVALTASAEPWRRAAALHVLDGQDAPAALAPALRLLADDPDARVRRVAVRAVPPAVGAREAQAVAAALARALATDQDPEVRRRAALELGDRARTAADLAPVLVALARDPAPQVRAGAAQACEVARQADPRVQAALVAALERRDEARPVRAAAWRALGACGPLEGAALAAWKARGPEVR